MNKPKKGSGDGRTSHSTIGLGDILGMSGVDLSDGEGGDSGAQGDYGGEESSGNVKPAMAKFGQSSGSGGGGYNMPFKTPSFWSRLLNPQGASMASQANIQSVLQQQQGNQQLNALSVQHSNRLSELAAEKGYDLNNAKDLAQANAELADTEQKKKDALLGNIMFNSGRNTAGLNGPVNAETMGASVRLLPALQAAAKSALDEEQNKQNLGTLQGPAGSLSNRIGYLAQLQQPDFANQLVGANTGSIQQQTGERQALQPSRVKGAELDVKAQENQLPFTTIKPLGNDLYGTTSGGNLNISAATPFRPQVYDFKNHTMVDKPPTFNSMGVFAPDGTLIRLKNPAIMPSPFGANSQSQPSNPPAALPQSNSSGMFSSFNGNQPTQPIQPTQSDNPFEQAKSLTFDKAPMYFHQRQTPEGTWNEMSGVEMTPDMTEIANNPNYSADVKQSLLTRMIQQRKDAYYGGF